MQCDECGTYNHPNKEVQHSRLNYGFQFQVFLFNNLQVEYKGLPKRPRW